MKQSTGLERSLWTTLLGALIVVPNLFALRQLRATGGYLFYTGAFDESTYLSYDGALLTRSLTHAAEYLVVGLHRLGVSGGYTNLLCDLLWPVVTVFLLRRLAIVLGFSSLESVVYPFVIVGLPVLLGYSNPYYSKLYALNFNSQGLSWVTLPQAYYPPFFRTPEPQISLAVVALASVAALRLRSYLVALAIVPFIYPFVGIPYLFVVIGLLVHDKLDGWIDEGALRGALSAAGGYLAIAATVFTFFVLFVRGTTLTDFLPPTHLPLLSGTGLLAIGIYWLTRSRFEARHRLPALLLALAPTAAANTQVLAGFLQTPHNLEQNFGVIALALVAVMALHATARGTWAPVGAAAITCCLFGLYSVQVFAVNASMLQRMPPAPELLDALRRNPESLVIADPDLADLFSLIAPKLHFSALARSQTLRSQEGSTGEPTTADRFQNYLCVKALLSPGRDRPTMGQTAFDVLDRSFRYLNQDFSLIHINRRHAFTQYFDPSAPPSHCLARPLTIFPSYVLGSEAGEPLPSLAVTTPPALWAYASVRALPAPPRPLHVDTGLAVVKTFVTVTRGCIDVGVLTPDQSSFVVQAELRSLPGEQSADLLIVPSEKPGWFVASNCSAAGVSEGVVRSVQQFPVERVTTRTLAAAPAGAAR
jgi:hypothetical protein